MKNIEDLAIKFCNGIYDSDIKSQVWPHVFKYLIQHSNDLTINQEAVHSRWIESGGHLRNKIRNDDLVLSVLQKYLPKYRGGADGMILYRGECRFLYEEGKIGFCWTPKKEIACDFARVLNSIESGGVLLQAHASSNAIIASPNNHSISIEEFEYTCNPKNLENIQVIKDFPKFEY